MTYVIQHILHGRENNDRIGLVVKIYLIWRTSESTSPKSDGHPRTCFRGRSAVIQTHSWTIQEL